MRELFESTIERLLGDLATPEYVLGCEDGVWAAKLWTAVEESGFTMAGVPEVMGGAEAGWVELYGLVRAVGRYSTKAVATGPWLKLMSNSSVRKKVKLSRSARLKP